MSRYLFVVLGSLRQLILFSFFLALMPLALLLWQNYQSLERLANIAETQAREAVDLTRSMSELKKSSVDMQRLYKQYDIVGQSSLLPLLQRQVNHSQQVLLTACEIADLKESCRALTNRLSQLALQEGQSLPAEPDQVFNQLSHQIDGFDAQVRQWLDNRLAAQQTEVQTMQQRITWQTLTLVIITLLMVWGASQLVIGPIQQIQKLIRAIASQQTELPAQHFQYPKELGELDQQLRWLAERLQSLEAVRHSMLRHASHELKTPLASLIEGCSLLKEEVVGRLDNQQKEVVDLISLSVERLNQLVEELLDYNRLLQEARSTPQRVALPKVIDSVISRHQLAAQQNEQKIVVSGAVSTVWADATLLQRILDNLINNAIAYGSRGTQIDIVTRVAENAVELMVSNRTELVEIAHCNSLLEPFQRGGQERNDGLKGTGLGLSIVADCARMMEGKVTIVSAARGLFSVQLVLPREGES